MYDQDQNIHTPVIF